MLSRPGQIAILCVLLSAALRAEDNCGSMMRTATRFRGTIRSVELLGGREIDVTAIDFDARFVVSVDVVIVEGESPALRPGQRRSFGVHSPALTFGPAKLDGVTMDLEAEWMVCDGVFRRFVSLRRLPPRRVIEDFNGVFEIGHSYRAEVKWESGSELTFVKRLYHPMHHDVGVGWTNLDHFPELTRSGRTRTVVFEVASVRIDHLAEWQWLSMYDLTLIAAR